MNLRVTRRERLENSGRAGENAPALPEASCSDAPCAVKRERLYAAIEDAQATLHKKVPPDAVMAQIRRWFPEPAYFIESSRQGMRKAGLSQLDACYYALIPNLTRTALSQQWGENPDLGALSRMAPYLQTLYVGVHVECFYLALLNRNGRLIRPVLLQRGAVDSAPFYLGQVLSTTLAAGARYIVLAHNHPGGTRNPSAEDLRCTLRALDAVAPLRLPLLDHIIVVPDGAVSIRETGLISELVWTAGGPGSRIVREWLDVQLLVD